MIENRKNGRFRKITQRRIHEIKNYSIWISNRGEIKERSGMKFPKIERSKTEIENKIKLNDEPKLQIDDTSQKIRGKTRFLTQDSDRNDPINHRIEAFHFMIS